jgi:hypothetical protein
VFIALLLVPLLVYLAVTGKLKDVSLFGVSAEFRGSRRDRSRTPENYVTFCSRVL